MENSEFNFTTATRTLLADTLTPVGIYMRLRDLHPVSALLESSDYHSHDNSRSFFAVDPIGSVAVSHGTATLSLPDGMRRTAPIGPGFTVADAINRFTGMIHVEGQGSAYCGLYGYTAFNAVRYMEPVPVRDEAQPRNDAPDVLYVLFGTVLVLDHFNNRLTLVQLLAPGQTSTLHHIERVITGTAVTAYPFKRQGQPTSTLTDAQHLANIGRCIAHCRRGDVFQIVISRRFVQRYSGDDFTLYRALRSINPSPYLFYFDFGGFRIFGSSPETHCRIAGCRAYIDPIAGTVPRTGDAERDRQNAEFLRRDPKENAEHVMLVDLARNDLSRHCHEVKVDFYKDMQHYSHVIHLVSRVSGILDPDADPVEAFLHTFPAGTLSGAPKVRAMQLISELEPHSRGIYGGCIGFIGLDGDLNQAIVIRTFVSRNGELWYQAGSGIVAKSDPQRELQEVNHKLAALTRAIDLAEQL